MADQPDKWHMDDLFALVLEREASDLHLKVGQPPVLRIGGEVGATEFAPLGPDEIRSLAFEIMDERLVRQFQETGAADFSRMLECGERFRINVYLQRGFASVAARRVSRRVPTFEELHLPEETLRRICEAREGLIIFCGITGCGKSTSIAACLDYINQQRPCHIVTIEDPVEFLFEDKKAFVNQREIGTDVASFEMALRCLMREDPDVVLVGETRDQDSCRGVLQAAETGHLVFTTLHAVTAAGAIVRVLDLFPAQERGLVRETLASNLVAVICQKLVAGFRPDAPRVPATEVLVSTPLGRKMIREGREDRLSDIVAAGADWGMHDFTQDLARLVLKEWVEPKTAYEVAPNAEALKMAIRGITVKRGTLE